MPPKKNYRNKNRRRKGPTVNKMAAIARRENYKMIPQKRHPFDGTAVLANSATGPDSILVNPTFIPGNDYTGAYDADEKIKRNTDQIYLERCSGIFDFTPPATCLNPVVVRHICGWWKGVAAASTDGPPSTIAALTSTQIQATFSSKLQRYDPDNYKIVSDRQYTLTPHAVFDANGSDDATGGETMTAIWKPQKLKCNFRFHRKFKYSNGKQHDDTEFDTSGASQMGWRPFIFLYVRAPNQQWSASNQCPIDYKFTSYFKDVQ